MKFFTSSFQLRNVIEMKLVCLFMFFAGLCHGVSRATECTARGRFPSNATEDCRGYIMCLLGGAGKFTQYNLTCPVSFVYSHLEQQCTNATNYRCMPDFLCNTTGNYENPLSNNCSSYVACPEGLNGLVTARVVECPAGTVFNLSEGCVTMNNTMYECNLITTTELVTEQPVTVIVPHNTTLNVQVTGENGFQLSSSVSMNSAVDVNCHHALLFTVLLFFNFN